MRAVAHLVGALGSVPALGACTAVAFAALLACSEPDTQADTAAVKRDAIAQARRVGLDSSLTDHQRARIDEWVEAALLANPNLTDEQIARVRAAAIVIEQGASK